jgi:hypothetical protein
VEVISVTSTAALVKCFRCAGDDCPQCDGTCYRERKRCEKCGEPSGRMSEGLRPLVDLRTPATADRSTTLAVTLTSDMSVRRRWT